MRRFIFSIFIPIGFLKFEALVGILTAMGIRVEKYFQSHTDVHEHVDFLDISAERFIEYLLDDNGLPITRENIQLLMKELNSSTDPPEDYYRRTLQGLIDTNADKLKEAK